MLSFGVYASDKPSAMVRQFRPILNVVEERMARTLGEPVRIRLQVAKTYEQGITDLVQGKVDFARFGPASYIEAKATDPGITILAVESKDADEEVLMEAALDAGAEDIREDNSNFEVISAPEDFEAVKAAMDEASITYFVAEVTMLPQSTTNLIGKEAEQMVRLMEMLEDSEDVQKVYTNADIPEEIVNNL